MDLVVSLGWFNNVFFYNCFSWNIKGYATHMKRIEQKYLYKYYIFYLYFECKSVTIFIFSVQLAAAFKTIFLKQLN